MVRRHCAALLAILVNRRLVGHEEWSLARRLVSRTAMQFIGRGKPLVETSHSPASEFHWKIIHKPRPAVSSAVVLKFATQEQMADSLKAAENKAA